MTGERTKAVIDLLDEKKLYVVKQGELIEHELPEFGEVTVVMHEGMVDRFEDKRKRKV